MFGRFLLSVLSYAALAASMNSSTFFTTQQGWNITFTLTAAADTGDLFFRMIGPGGYDWISIGIGTSMKDALTFITYPAYNGTCTRKYLKSELKTNISRQRKYGHRDYQPATLSQPTRLPSIAFLSGTLQL
jgi:hypothetical protein